MVSLCGWQDQRTLGHLKHCNRVLAGDTGERIQKVIERMTRFQIGNKALHRHARAREDWRATEALENTGDSWIG